MNQLLKIKKYFYLMMSLTIFVINLLGIFLLMLKVEKTIDSVIEVGDQYQILFLKTQDLYYLKKGQKILINLNHKNYSTYIVNWEYNLEMKVYQASINPKLPLIAHTTLNLKIVYDHINLWQWLYNHFNG